MAHKLIKIALGGRNFAIVFSSLSGQLLRTRRNCRSLDVPKMCLKANVLGLLYFAGGSTALATEGAPSQLIKCPCALINQIANLFIEIVFFQSSFGL